MAIETDRLLTAFVNAAMEVGGELPVDITEDSGIDALGIDSLSLIEISMILEDDLGITLKSEEFEGAETVGDLLAVFARLAAAA